MSFAEKKKFGTMEKAFLHGLKDDFMGMVKCTAKSKNTHAQAIRDEVRRAESERRE